MPRVNVEKSAGEGLPSANDNQIQNMPDTQANIHLKTSAEGWITSDQN